MGETTILLGGNQGNPLQTFHDCRKKLEMAGFEIIKTSKVYQSKSWGYQSNFPFYNQAIVIKTNILPPQLLNELLNIEIQLGRIRETGTGYMDRLIDIDIILSGSEVINTPNLTVPHPRMQERKFCLIPLNEIIPHKIHPVFQKSMEELLLECTDQSEVKPI